MKNNKKTYKFYIAGAQYHSLESVIKKLEVGDNLQLVPEPSNEYDKNAVRIEYNDIDKNVMCGYVPMFFSNKISEKLKMEKQLECVIIELNKDADPWEMCKVEIKEIKGKIN